MNDRFNVGTFMWGVFLTVVGAALAAIGFGWWDISTLDLRYVGPALVILMGVTILTGALVSRRDAGTDSG